MLIPTESRFHALAPPLTSYKGYVLRVVQSPGALAATGVVCGKTAPFAYATRYRRDRGFCRRGRCPAPHGGRFACRSAGFRFYRAPHSAALREPAAGHAV